MIFQFCISFSVADLGFPVGRVYLVGGVGSRGSYVSEILYVEMKKSGPWGAWAGHAP